MDILRMKWDERWRLRVLKYRLLAFESFPMLKERALSLAAAVWYTRWLKAFAFPGVMCVLQVSGAGAVSGETGTQGYT
jgi:hypothetical protein